MLLIVLNGIEMRNQTNHLKQCQPFNRTKWNWNGRATREQNSGHYPFNRTKWNWNLPDIVPFPAMSAFNRTKWNWNEVFASIRIFSAKLLIVLNGIEISFKWVVQAGSYSFNRTKWNWNLVILVRHLGNLTFNRTKWNWNLLAASVWTSCLAAFNRTNWNWNIRKLT